VKTAYFALDDPFENLPLVLVGSLLHKPEGNPFETIGTKSERVEVPWDAIKRENSEKTTLSSLLNRFPGSKG